MPLAVDEKVEEWLLGLTPAIVRDDARGCECGDALSRGRDDDRVGLLDDVRLPDDRHTAAVEIAGE